MKYLWEWFVVLVIVVLMTLCIIKVFDEITNLEQWNSTCLNSMCE